MSDPLKNGAPPKKRGLMRREHTGWLVLFCVFSLLIHLGAGYTSRSFNFDLPKNLPTPPPAEVEIALAPAPPVPAAPTTNPPIFTPATPQTTTPQAKPQPAPPPKQPVERETPKVPQEFTRTIPKTRNTPVETPTPRKVETTPDRAPEPLPLGLRNGQRNLPEITATPSPQPLPSVETTPPPPTATPPPTRLQATAPERPQGGGGAGVPLEFPSVVTPDAPSRPALGEIARAPLTGGKNGGSGGGSGGGEGNKTGAGNGTSATNLGPYGITRGVPFGDRLGVPKGNPNGGGGGNPFAPGFRFHNNPTNTDNTPPVHVVYVIDTSGSMEEGGKIKRAQEALEKALNELRTDDTFNIVPFSDRARLMFPQMSKVTNATMAQAESNIEFMSPNGDTNLSDALDLALAQNGVSHVFVMSDGDPTKGIIEYDEILEHVKERNTNNVHIIALALGLGEKFPGMKLLRALAEQNGGKFDYVNLRGR